MPQCRNGPFHRIFSSVFEAQVGELLIVLAPHLAVDLEESREYIGTGRQCAVGVNLIDQLRHQRVIDRKIADAELLRKQLEPELGGGFRAGRVAGEHHGRKVVRQVPGIREHGEALLGAARQGETAEGVFADLHARLVPRSPGSHHGEFHTALIDVVLRVVGSNARRRQCYLHGGRRGVRMAREIVGIRLHHEARVAFLQIRRLALAGDERQGLRWLLLPPEQPVGGRLDFGQRITRAALFDVRTDAAYPVRIGNFHRDRSGDADDLDLRIDGQHGVRRHCIKRDHTDDGEKGDGYEYFHFWL